MIPRRESLHYAFLRCMTTVGRRDRGGPMGETDDAKAERLAPIAVRALNRARMRVGCALALMPGRLVYPEINGYEAVRRRRHRKAKAAQFRPLLPGYFTAGFMTPTPPWPLIKGLAGGRLIIGPLTHITRAHPEGEPRMFSADEMHAMELEMNAGGVGLLQRLIAKAPEHHAYQRTGHEFEAGDRARITAGPYKDFEGPVTRIAGASAWVDILVFGSPVKAEVSADMLEKVA